MAKLLLILALVALGWTGLTADTAWSARERPDLVKKVGERVPLLKVTTSQGTLADYDHNYYGRHHLVLTFVPAAFTPI